MNLILSWETTALSTIMVLIIATCVADAEAEELSSLPRPSAFHSTRELAPYFDKGEFTAATSVGEVLLVPYRLFRPRNQDLTKKYPLIVWLHGFGNEEKANYNSGQLLHLWLVFPNPPQLEKSEFFLLAPQNSVSRDWYPGCGEVVVDLIHKIVAENPIDPTRITLVGISSGAEDSWEFVTRNPELFAAVAPLAAFLPESPLGERDAVLKAIANVPIWAFHSAEDDFSQDAAEKVVEDLRTRGGRCALTVIPWKDHNCWTEAFGKHNLLNWLLSQRKGDPTSPLPGEPIQEQWKVFARANWPQAMVALVAACALVVMTCQYPNFWYRRRKNSSQKGDVS